MHHSEYHGYQFNYNGDYSGDILVTDHLGFEWPAMTFDRILYVITDPVVSHMRHIKPLRAFVAEAVRMVSITSLEQMETDDLLNTPLGKSLLADGLEPIGEEN